MGLQPTSAVGRRKRLPLALAAESPYVGQTGMSTTMTPESLRSWLLQHADLIDAFTDFRPHDTDESVLRDVLEFAWFRDPQWNEPGYCFLPLGADGTGGEAAVWLPQHNRTSAPVVFFGSEGGSGILAPSPGAFAQALAHGPIIEEYHTGSFDLPSYLSPSGNWLLSTDAPDQATQAREALASYRLATEHHFGELPSLDVLTAVPSALQEQFSGWVRQVVSRATAREERAALHLRESKRLDQLTKATSYARASSLAPEQSELRDGAQVSGTCAACGNSGKVRLTKFEQLAFTLCSACYFSKAW